MSNGYRTSRFEAVIATLAMALVTAATFYFSNGSFATYVNSLIPH